VIANAARYLVRLGLRVFAMDLDLEAPGLHYKLQLDKNRPISPIDVGVVDILTEFLNKGVLPESLAPYTLEVEREEEHGGQFYLMPAGNVPNAAYWRKLARVNWHQLFYSEEPLGIPFFLELKERIKSEFEPDFLLIDSRTGITEIGGVATSVLPDQLVCLLMNNQENLEGARAILRSVKLAQRLPGQSPVEIVPVLSRLPIGRGRSIGIAEPQLASIAAYLSEPAEPPEATLHFPDVLVLHSEEELEYHETLRIGGERTVDESPLLRDYLRLFSHLIPKKVVEPHLDKLIHVAQKDMLENPLTVQRDLEALVVYCPHPESYLALLKFYRLRSASSSVMLTTAARYWELSRDTSNPLLWETIREHFKFQRERRATRDWHNIPLEFIEAVWEEAGADNTKIGIGLAEAYFSGPFPPNRGAEVIGKLLAHREPREESVVAAIECLIHVERIDVASQLIERFRETLCESAQFQAAWAKLAAKCHDPGKAKALLELKTFRPAKLQADHPLVYARLLKLAGQEDELEAALRSSLLQIVSREGSRLFPTPDLMEVGRLFAEMGKREQFEQQLKQMLPREQVDQFIRHMMRF